MPWSLGGRATQRAPGVFLAVACAMALAACNPEDRPGASASQPRGATVAFESIDGPPPGQFHELVQALNTEAQTRRLAVLSRESPSAYRVRGYLSAKVVKRETTISWVWDIFDGDDRRALRIAGEETAKNRPRDAWSVADDAMLQRIAHSSMDQLSTFLTSSDVAPGTPDSGPRLALAEAPDSSPEAAGIFRIFQAKADPAPADSAEVPVAAGPVPLPPPRPTVVAAISGPDRLALASASR